MAHILDIPIRFRFLKIPAKWEIRTVNGQPHHKAQQFAFAKVLGDPFEMDLPELDGWKYRDAFFELAAGDDEKLLKFLADVGVFSNLELSGHWSEEVSQHCREGHPLPIDPCSVWRFREGLRDALLDKKAFRETYASPLPRNTTAREMVQEPGIEFPLRFELGDVTSGVVTTTDAYHMLLATVYADVARGIRFKTCRREDCLKPFPIASEHARKFCSQYCGHLVSQRKKRAAEQKEKREAKRKRARRPLR
jgi:hypothetical protein